MDVEFNMTTNELTCPHCKQLELENERLKDAIVTWHAYHTHEAHVECGCAACYAMDRLAMKLSTEIVR